jgi:uncharacterized protein YecE (DUF72 family)
MELCVGTSGYAYKEWKGKFYPEKHPDKEMLSYYAGKLGAVEINNTFYRMPNESLLAGWASQVPGGFRFALKAPQRITHIKRLKDVGQETAHLVTMARTLGERLGVILFQLPPNFRKDAARLDAFLDGGLPADVPAAVEFRHESWFDEETFAKLRARGVALCVADTDEGDTPLVGTAGIGYLRLRRATYTDDDLAAWATKIAAQEWARTFVFFKHEDEAAGPLMAMRFREIARG